MPLHESKTKPQSWEDIREQFAIFYASKGDDGVMWCPVRSIAVQEIRAFFCFPDQIPRSQDCRAVKEIIEETFDKDHAPTALIIYVGQKLE